MEQKIMLLCSGYGAETGSDLLAVKLFENTETGEVHTEVTGGIRQGESPRGRQGRRGQRVEI